MTRDYLSIKRGFPEKLREAKRILAQKGLPGLCYALRSHLVYHLRSKWSFVYLEFPLDQKISSFRTKEAVTVRIATEGDLDKIRADIFPSLKGELGYEKIYFQLLNQPGVKCFLGECKNKFVHYSWVFLDAFQSPIVEVPFDRNQLRAKDAYVGPIFTSPEYRGFVYLEVLSAILRFLRDEASCERVLVLVQGENPSAVSFYKRMGFKEISDAQPRNIFSYIEKRTKWLIRSRLKRIREYLLFSS